MTPLHGPLPGAGVCVICTGVAPLTLAQTCATPVPSCCVQAKACGGGAEGVAVARASAVVAVGVPTRATLLELPHAPSNSTNGITTAAAARRARARCCIRSPL